MWETHLMWTLKAWAEWGVPRSWVGRHVGGLQAPLLAPGGDVRQWGLAQVGQGRKGGPGRQTHQGTLKTSP